MDQGPGDTESPLEASPTILGAWFTAMVAGLLEAMETAATQTSISLSYDQKTALFRQVCFFCDALWGKVLLPNRALAVGRIPSSPFQTYLEPVREKAMEAIALAEYLPEEWRNWSLGVSQEDLQKDFNFYMQGVVPPEWESDFSIVLSLTRVKQDGLIHEFAARLYLRACQIIGLIEKRDLLAHVAWWNRLATLNKEYAKTFPKIIPVPE
ncbi:MAG: hypothetical protein C4293_00080 [Nitrospiraceae bacterium]